ncbi:MAG: hypothetical protein PVH19_07880 [Planctomycetia bacterium]|jgi:hypothetical protein
MIAPIRETKPKRRRTGGSLHTARTWIASTLCGSQDAPTPIARWKAWLFVSWIFLVTILYGLSMLGR